MIALETARAVAREMCSARGVRLVTPDDAPVLRFVVHMSIALASPLTPAQIRERVSVYVPRLVANVVDLLPDEIAALLDVDAPLILLSASAWSDGDALSSVLAHELGHNARDLAVRASAPDLPLAPLVASVLWGVGYLAHARIRIHEESTCYLADLVMAVVARNEDPHVAAAGILAALREAYRPGDAMDAAESTMASGVASLLAGELPGVKTPVHDVLKALRAKGETFGRWDAVVDAA